MSYDQVKQAFEVTEKVLNALKVIVDKPMQEDRGNVDAAIHRFEFSIELFWKLLKRILILQGVEAVYPKEVLQQAYAGHLIDQEQVWLAMLRDRNLTSHTYNEQLADEIYENVKKYYPILAVTFKELKAKYYSAD